MSDTDGFPLPLGGGCLCGQLRYRVSAAPAFIFACHCTDCQRLTSSAFSLGMPVAKAGFVSDGEARVWEKRGESGGWSRQFRCAVCETWTHTQTEHTQGLVIVRPATLDDARWVRPVAQIFTRSALPWALMSVPHSFEAEFDDPETLKAAFHSSGIRPDKPGTEGRS